jgi:hypothetical protein
VSEPGAPVPAAADSTKAPILDAATRDTLVRVLDRRLVILALASVLGEDARIPDLMSGLDLPIENGMVLVAMKVETAGGKPAAAMLDALRAAGGVASAEDGARGLVVAKLPPSALLALAKTAGVIRIEALEMGEIPAR